MGRGKIYRWERRRAKKARRLKSQAFASFWGFEIILLVLIFSVWLIGARIFQSYALTQSPCVEALVAFGQLRPGVSAFDLLFWISVFMGVFWGAITINFWTILRRSKSTVFHLLLLISIGFLAANFRLMHVDDFFPPDGTLSVRETVIDRSGSEPKYSSLLVYGDQFGAWYLGRSNSADNIDYMWTSTTCVWLDRNLVSGYPHIEIDGYADLSVDDKIKAVQSRPKRIARWARISFTEQMRLLLSGATNDVTPTEALMSRQQYRQLLPEERERFLAKQECLKENMFSPTITEDCRYYWGTDMEAEYLFWLNSD